MKKMVRKILWAMAMIERLCPRRTTSDWNFDLNTEAETASKSDPQRPILWDLPVYPNGFYRVYATLDRGGATVLAKETSFVVMESAPGVSAGEFGWSVG